MSDDSDYEGNVQKMNRLKAFREKHAGWYEFIMFNLLSNIATITNFVVLNIGISLLFVSFTDTPFRFWVFDYEVESGGLGGFLAFLLSYASAQTVNFIVQRKLVFKANNKLGINIVIYVAVIIIVYLICLYVPTVLLAPLTGWVGSFWAVNMTNGVNILIQVAIIFPVLKFVVMKKLQANELEQQRQQQVAP